MGPNDFWLTKEIQRTTFGPGNHDDGNHDYSNHDDGNHDYSNCDDGNYDGNPDYGNCDDGNHDDGNHDEDNHDDGKDQFVGRASSASWPPNVGAETTVIIVILFIITIINILIIIITIIIIIIMTCKGNWYACLKSDVLFVFILVALMFATKHNWQTQTQKNASKSQSREGNKLFWPRLWFKGEEVGGEMQVWKLSRLISDSNPHHHHHPHLLPTIVCNVNDGFQGFLYKCTSFVKSLARWQISVLMTMPLFNQDNDKFGF